MDFLFEQDVLLTIVYTVDYASASIMRREKKRDRERVCVCGGGGGGGHWILELCMLLVG
jgi:hypothetical protein